MLLNVDFINLGMVPLELLEPLQQVANKINWTHPEFNRDKSSSLISRIVRVPYNKKPEYHQEITPNIKRILEAFSPIDQWMQSKYFDYVFIKCEICMLMPNSLLKFHIDPSWFHQYARRIHVPVITNKQCQWWVEDRSAHFNVGDHYEVNNRRFHCATNLGDTPRLHLIFDILDTKLYNQAKESNQNFGEVCCLDTGMYSHSQMLEKLSEFQQLNYY